MNVKNWGKMDYHFLTFSYVYKMAHSKLLEDKDLMKMFERNAEKELIYIWIGTTITPDKLYSLVMNFRRRSKLSNAGVEGIEGADGVVAEGLEDLAEI